MKSFKQFHLTEALKAEDYEAAIVIGWYKNNGKKFDPTSSGISDSVYKTLMKNPAALDAGRNIAKAIANKFGNTLNDTFKRRLTSLFQPYELDFQQAIHLDQCWGALKKCRVADAVKTIKTWSNAWATSSRYHEGILLPCLFGCTCTDHLEHYLQCPHLFALWTFLVGNVSSDPLVRWGLIRPEPNVFLQIVCVFFLDAMQFGES